MTRSVHRALPPAPPARAGGAPTLLALAEAPPCLAVYCATDCGLSTYSINLLPLASAPAGERLACIAAAPEGGVLATAGDGGCLSLRSLPGLELLVRSARAPWPWLWFLRRCFFPAAAQAPGGPARGAGRGVVTQSVRGQVRCPLGPGVRLASVALLTVGDEPAVAGGTEDGRILLWHVI